METLNMNDVRPSGPSVSEFLANQIHGNMETIINCCIQSGKVFQSREFQLFWNASEGHWSALVGEDCNMVIVFIPEAFRHQFNHTLLNQLWGTRIFIFETPRKYVQCTRISFEKGMRKIDLPSFYSVDGHRTRCFDVTETSGPWHERAYTILQQAAREALKMANDEQSELKLHDSPQRLKHLFEAGRNKPGDESC